MSKRLFDFTVALLGILLLAPLFVIVACLIKADSLGPIFFRQSRIGRNGVPFKVLKFRTMAENSEALGLVTVGNDLRISKVGHLLRRYKLDELPQLFNVLNGDMSLVGPRPEVPEYVALYPAELREVVLSVSPGITDYASIAYRDENRLLGESADPERTYIEEILPLKLLYCEEYVRRRSFGMDVRIIFLTLAKIWGPTAG